MRCSTMLAALLGVAMCSAIELTSSNYAEKTSGKQVFVKFLAPW